MELPLLTRRWKKFSLKRLSGKQSPDLLKSTSDGRYAFYDCKWNGTKLVARFQKKRKKNL